MMITADEYCMEIQEIAYEAIVQVRDYGRDLDEVIWEFVHAHAWIVCFRNNLGVMMHTNNGNAADDIGGVEKIVRKRGVNCMAAFIASCAMMADIRQAANMTKA